ncbi:MAG: NADP-dependent isocitrate dehydrogenase [Spirochaetales bacterium]|nr:NADP-dependent isocitrate dehydrogenase [Spirochaetales bacterium]
MQARIIYTKTDEAPALATRSLLPVISAFTGAAGVKVETRDISLAGRIIASFPEYLDEDKRIADALAELGDMVHQKDANIIKLPNISASIPQLKAAIAELQARGYKVPDYPGEAETPEELSIQSRYDKIKGSAVNPVLREGNSDRRAPASVKSYAKNNPHSMGPWKSDSASHVASMTEGDFYGSEKSVTLESEDSVKIIYKGSDGTSSVLKESFPLQKSEIIDAAVMSRKALRLFLKEQAEDAAARGVLFSIHLKATMMKVSDPVIFGHAVSVFFEEVFEKYSHQLGEIGVDPNMGLGDLYSRLDALDSETREALEADLKRILNEKADLAMVNSDKGITNLHVPSDVIIDASMPAAIRSSGCMWNKNGELQDTKFVIPDRSYAGVYSSTIDFCKKHGAFDPSVMGSVSNVGLMAQKAEEYGSHDKTFTAPGSGVIDIVGGDGSVLLSQNVEEGDIFRACQVKDAPVRDWVGLAVKRAAATKAATVFWLDPQRAHDAQLISKVNTYLSEYNTEGLDIRIMSPVEATLFSLEEIRQGRDAVSVTGNVLRDYLTDLFPILELGTSAKMLSIVPLMEGGGLFETGAGGSAPKHVQQFNAEGHLRWDSLGEFLALAVSLEHLASVFDNDKARILAGTLDQATAELLEKRKSPSRKVNELDNRGSHFYLALYWAEALARQDEDLPLKKIFTPLAAGLAAKEDIILSELLEAQGHAVDIGGYYFPDEELADRAMRPSATLNTLIDSLSADNL